MPIQHLNKLYTELQSAGVAVVSVNSDGIVSPPSLQAAAQPHINAFDDSPAAQLNFENLSARQTASAAIDTDKTTLLKIARAEAALLTDELNTLRQWLMSFKTEVAAATTLADLKTRVATLPNLPDRTLAQAKTALKNKIDTGNVD